jgi:hypothetical protein
MSLRPDAGAAADSLGEISYKVLSVKAVGLTKVRVFDDGWQMGESTVLVEQVQPRRGCGRWVRGSR